MIKHDIKEGLSTIYEKETSPSDANSFPDSVVLDFLLSTPAILSMIINASKELLLREKNYWTLHTKDLRLNKVNLEHL